MDGLSVSGLADLAGATEAEVERLVELGVLVAREGAGPFRESDVPKVRLAVACEQAGLPMEGIAAAIRAGRLSFAFLETALYRRWAVRSGPTYQQVSQDTGVPLELLGSALEAMGFAPMTSEEPITEDELEVVPLLQRGFASGLLDLAWFTRVGRAHAEGLRLIVAAWNQAYRVRIEGPVLAAGGDHRAAMEEAPQLSVDFLPLMDRALLAGLRRQQELLWTEGPGRAHRGRARGRRDAGAAGAGPGDDVPGPGGLHLPHRGTGRSRPGRCCRRWSWWPGSPTPGSPRPMSGWPPGRWSSRAATTSAAP